jgi:hypothetical protein
LERMIIHDQKALVMVPDQSECFLFVECHVPDSFLESRGTNSGQQ